MKERMKDLLLIVLFLGAVALTGLLLVDKNAYFTNTSEITVKTTTKIDPKEYVKPYNYEVTYTGNEYTVIYDNMYEKVEVWDLVVGSIGRFFDFGELEEIETQKWNDEKRNRSLTVNFEYNFTFDEFRQFIVDDENNITTKNELSDIRFSSIIIPARETQIIFLGDKVSGKYYALKDIPITMEKISDFIDIIYWKSTKKEIVNYWTLTSVLGGQEESANILLPVFNTGRIAPINISKEIDLSVDSNLNIRSYAGKMFGENFEFVNKNKLNDGSILYMYGYGDKSYRFSADGSIEFIDKTNEITNTDFSFSEGLNITLEGLSNVGEIPENLYLKGFERKESLKSKEAIYKFGYKINGYPIEQLDRNYADLEVEIRDGNIYRIYKNVRRYRSADNSDEIIKFPTIIGKENVIVFIENYIDFASTEIEIETEQFYINLKDYLERIKQSSEDIQFDEVLIKLLQEIKNFNLEYYIVEYENEEVMLPTWQFNIGDTHYIINAYNQTILSDTEL